MCKRTLKYIAYFTILSQGMKNIVDRYGLVYSMVLLDQRIITKSHIQHLVDVLCRLLKFGCLFAVSDNRLFMEKFQEIAESLSTEEENEDATEAAGLLKNLSVEERKTKEKAEEEAPAATKSGTVKEDAPAEEKVEEKAEGKVPAAAEEEKKDT